MEIEWVVAILIVLVGAGASFVQRVSGFGLGIFAMLFLPHVLPTSVAAATISCLFSCGTSTYNAVKYRKDTPYKTVLPLLIAALVVIPFAVYFASAVSDRVFGVLLGSVLIALSVYFLLFDKKIQFKPTAVKGVLCGALGGALNGLFSTGRPPVVLYMTHATTENKKYFAGIQFYFCITNIYATVMRAVNGLVSLTLLVYALIGMAGCLVGDFIGKLVFDKLDAKKLKTIIYFAMIISGILMIV